MNSLSLFLSNIIIISLLVGMISLILYIIYCVIKNERTKNKYLPTMKVGDSVHFSTSQSIDCTVTNLKPTQDENIVEVSVLIHKSSLYPGKSTKSEDIIW